MAIQRGLLLSGIVLTILVLGISAEKSYYQILGVPKNAPQSQIKSAYRKLSKQYHPDVSKEPDAKAKFQEISEGRSCFTKPMECSVTRSRERSTTDTEKKVLSRDNREEVIHSEIWGRILAQKAIFSARSSVEEVTSLEEKVSLWFSRYG
jgi:hypothetical protein